MKLIEPISAITPWEDYEYQGHIALYIALKQLYGVLCDKENILSCELQIEGEEDFSLRKESKYLSLHQVKAGAIKLEANDKFSFIAEILQNNADYGYFHIINKKKIPTDFVSSTLTYIKELQSELKKKIVEKKELTKSDKEEDYIIVDKISGNHKKASVYSMIKYVSGNSKEVSVIKKIIKDIDKELDEYTKRINDTVSTMPKTDSKEDEVFLDIYPERFDNVKEIREKAYEVIVAILKLERKEFTFVDLDYAALVYDQLFLFMKEKITEFNKGKKKYDKCILTFSEIFETVTVDYHEKIDTVSYQYFQVLRAIRDTYAEYPNKSWSDCKAENCNECSNVKVCNLFEQINVLNSKTEDEKNQIIHNLLLKTPQVGKNNNLPSDSMISHLFLNLLDEINTLYLSKKNVFQTIKDGEEIYRMTLDGSYDIDDFQKNLKKELEKDTDKSLMYECDVLITDRLNKNALFFNGGDVIVLTEKELDEIREITSTTVEKMKLDCNRPKVVRLVDKSTALGELK